MAMSANTPGFMAIWKSIDDADATDYLHWLTREHVFERVGVPGFRSGRVFRHTDPVPRRFFILYDLDNAGVLTSAPYLERLNNPTPWSQRAMQMMRDFTRGGGQVTADAGGGAGGWVALMRFETDWPAALQDQQGQSLALALADLDGVARVRVLESVQQATALSTREKTFRAGGDQTYQGVLLLEGLEPERTWAAAGTAVEHLRAAGCAHLPEVHRYHTVFSAHAGVVHTRA
jgi:hypothetical protein